MSNVLYCPPYCKGVVNWPDAIPSLNGERYTRSGNILNGLENCALFPIVGFAFNKLGFGNMSYGLVN